MADDVAITAGSGTTIATDDVSGVHYQRVKLTDGTADSSTVIAAGGGVEAGALRVTIANDSTGVVSVDDNGSSLTVDGSVTVTQGTATNLKAQAEAYQGGTAVGSGNPLQVTLANTGANTNKLLVTADAITIAGSQTLATVTTITNDVGIKDNGNSITVDQGTATNLKAQAECYQGGTAVSEAAPLNVYAHPSKLPTTDDAVYVRKYYTNSGAVTDGIVWSPAPGKRWYVTDIIVNVSAACTITFEDDKTGGDDPVMKFELAANGGFSKSFRTPFASGEDAADLIVTTSTGNIYIAITGYEV